VVPVASLQTLGYHHLRIGHLTFTGFTDGSGDRLRTEVRSALDAGAQRLILDLRENGGGLISEAINVASAFIQHGEIMSAEERGKPRRVYMARDDAIAAHIPMVVLVDHGTASAAEIVTAALQDQGRTEVVGTETYGKGVFQVTAPLINGGALDITVGKYFSPNGHNLGGGGARPGPGITPNVHATDDPQTPTDEALAAAERTVAAEGGERPYRSSTAAATSGACAGWVLRACFLASFLACFSSLRSRSLLSRLSFEYVVFFLPPEAIRDRP
jgi:carboxyl-terminal processing protease